MDHIPVRHIQITSKEADISEGCSIRDVQALLAGKDMVQELHRHNFFYVLALKKGRGTHEIDFTPYEIGDNTIFFMRPGQVHQLTLKAGSQGYLVAFTTDFYYPHDRESGQLLRQASNRNRYQLEDHRFKKIYSILTYIFQEYTDKEEGYQKIIQANLSVCLLELLRQQRSTTRDKAGTYTQERLEELLLLIETHICDYKQVAQYAAMMNLSPYQLNAITKATLGKTCSTLIDEHIILEARRYLLATSSQVSQIADLLGYEDVSYFIRFFKKHTGYSPETFRQNCS